MFETILPFDIAFSKIIQAFISSDFTFLMQFVSWVFTAFPLFVFAAWLYWSRKEKDSFYFVNLLLLSAIFAKGLKLFFKRLRPRFSGSGITDFENHSLSDYSFPSGHATLAGAVVGYFWKQVQKFEKVIVVLLTLLVAFSRIYLGAHFLSDVLAGLLVGFFVGKLNCWLRKRTEHMHFKITKFREEVLLFGFVIVSIAVMVFFKELVIAAAVIGYFTGYSLLKELKIEQTGKSLKRKLAGLACLAIIYAGTFNLDSQQKFVSFFLIGFWVTFLYPLGYESLKHHKKDKKRKH
ncbi:phosphatase PAP2 family protein [archaeon]|nr:phosphatase PAP2 family protein [archaeon]